jgi:cell shape-determining protein MreD
MMRDTRIRRLPMALSALVALALAVLPLPSMLEALRPDFLVLVVFYWSTAWCSVSTRSRSR